MARTRFPSERGLGVRMVWVMFLLGVLYAAAIIIAVAAAGRAWPVAIVAIAVFAAFQVVGSGRIATLAVGAREVTPEEAPQLHAVVDRLCALADMPKPKVARSSSQAPMAFAAGSSPGKATLCVSQGMIDRLEPVELEGVVAHELSHIAHRDVAVMTVASFLGVLAGLIARVGARLMYFGGRARGLWHVLAAALAVTALAAITWALSTVLTRSLSRYREYAADRSAALLTGNPSAISGALTKLAGAKGIPSGDLRTASALNAFHFCPLSDMGKSVTKRGATVLSSHPTVADRIARLERIAAELGTHEHAA